MAADDTDGAGPRVTVIVPTYNRAHWLGESLGAILAQTYDDFVVRVYDNASTDDTAGVVARFDDERLSYTRRPRNVGLVGNHNLAMADVTSEYCLIVPDDDVVGPRLLAAAVDVLDAHPSAGMVHTNFDMIDASGTVLHRDVNWTHGLESTVVEPGRDFIRESMRWSCRVCASTALMRTAALPPGLFDDEEFPAVDLGMWLRMALSWDMAFLAENHGRYRIHDTSHSAAFGPAIEQGYVQGTAIISRLREMKLRFLERHAPKLHDVAELRRLCDEATRHELLVLVRNLTLPQRRLSETVRALVSAAEVDRGVLVDWAAWRLVGASVLGGRILGRLRPGPAHGAQAAREAS